MSETFVLVLGIDDAINAIQSITPKVQRSLLRAVNFTTTRGRTRASRAILKQVAFPASYLAPSQGRLVAVPTKDKENPVGLIRAQTRPTSLARFTNGKPLLPGQRRSSRGLRITVKPGVARYTGTSSLNGAFLIPLRAGKDGALSNIGLALRSETPPKGAYRPRKLGKNLWLLYGPSVASVLHSDRNNGGVADEISPELAGLLEAEFYRQLDLD